MELDLKQITGDIERDFLTTISQRILRNTKILSFNKLYDSKASTAH